MALDGGRQVGYDEDAMSGGIARAFDKLSLGSDVPDAITAASPPPCMQSSEWAQPARTRTARLGATPAASRRSAGKRAPRDVFLELAYASDLVHRRL